MYHKQVSKLLMATVQVEMPQRAIPATLRGEKAPHSTLHKVEEIEFVRQDKYISPSSTTTSTSTTATTTLPPPPPPLHRHHNHTTTTTPLPPPSPST
jgi:hypothetical protein